MARFDADLMICILNLYIYMMEHLTQQKMYIYEVGFDIRGVSKEKFFVNV